MSESSRRSGEPTIPGARIQPVSLAESGLEFRRYLLPEFIFTGHGTLMGSSVEIPDKYWPYFHLVAASPDIFPGFCHADLEGNVRPKLKMLREVGFYQAEAPVAEHTAESCGAHSHRVSPQNIANRA